jgi:hypothetical protein
MNQSLLRIGIVMTMLMLDLFLLAVPLPMLFNGCGWIGIALVLIVGWLVLWANLLVLQRLFMKAKSQ